jgi:hypothetical protein
MGVSSRATISEGVSKGELHWHALQSTTVPIPTIGAGDLASFNSHSCVADEGHRCNQVLFLRWRVKSSSFPDDRFRGDDIRHPLFALRASLDALGIVLEHPLTSDDER